MSSPETQKQDFSKLYEEFSKFGDWTAKKTIGDYPVLGGDIVSPKYVFEQIAERLARFKKLYLPERVLGACVRMKEFGYDDHVLTSYLVDIDIQIDNTYILLGGLQYVEDICSVAEKSKSKEEFELRVGKIRDANTNRMQALMAGYEDLKRKEPGEEKK